MAEVDHGTLNTVTSLLSQREGVAGEEAMLSLLQQHVQRRLAAIWGGSSCWCGQPSKGDKEIPDTTEAA